MASEGSAVSNVSVVSVFLLLPPTVNTTTQPKKGSALLRSMREEREKRKATQASLQDGKAGTKIGDLIGIKAPEKEAEPTGRQEVRAATASRCYAARYGAF